MKSTGIGWDRIQTPLHHTLADQPASLSLFIHESRPTTRAPVVKTMGALMESCVRPWSCIRPCSKTRSKLLEALALS